MGWRRIAVGIGTGMGVALLVGGLLWPVECWWHPSLPPQGPFCTTFYRLPTSDLFALGAAVVVGGVSGVGAVRWRGR